MRGKGINQRDSRVAMRITPAYAGKRLLRQLRHITSRDHPRVCGEKVGPVGCVSGWLGSPPRMRGKVWHGVALADGHRITPAYAGKSCIYRSTTSISWDHPRVCGEKGAPVPNVPVAAGSPPRMRGKVPRNLTDYQTRRITPAYAGKRRALLFQARQYGDHPRVCGEKGPAMPYLLCSSGSPPRMRGKAQPSPGCA